MKTTITLELDADLLRELRAVADQKGTSVNRILAETLEEILHRHRSYDVARRRALSLLQKGLDLHWRKSSRDDVHERACNE